MPAAFSTLDVLDTQHWGRHSKVQTLLTRLSEQHHPVVCHWSQHSFTDRCSRRMLCCMQAMEFSLGLLPKETWELFLEVTWSISAHSALNNSTASHRWVPKWLWKRSSSFHWVKWICLWSRAKLVCRLIPLVALVWNLIWSWGKWRIDYALVSALGQVVQGTQ
jgi:hypothetical protein